MPIQCPKCKALNRDTATFCDNCGFRLIETLEQVISKQEGEPGDLTPKQPLEPPPQPPVKPPKIRGYTGIVSRLREERETKTKTTQRMGLFSTKIKNKPIQVHYWILDLQRADKDWQPLKDRKGFQLPVLEVRYKATKVHGPRLEEGSRVVVKGHRRGYRIKAKKIWNLSPGVDMPGSTLIRGRVTNWQSPRQIQDIRYPGQGRYVEIWDFRLQRTDKDFQELLRDEQGNLLPALPIEIRAQVVSGPLQEGDKVEVRGQVVHGTLYTKEVCNHSAGGAALVVKEWAGIP